VRFLFPHHVVYSTSTLFWTGPREPVAINTSAGPVYWLSDRLRNAATSLISPPCDPTFSLTFGRDSQALMAPPNTFELKDREPSHTDSVGSRGKAVDRSDGHGESP
jgi:hypothetical protein